MEAEWAKIATESGVLVAMAAGLGWFARWMVRHILTTHKADRESWEKERELMRLDHQSDRNQWRHDMDEIRASFMRSIDVHENNMSMISDRINHVAAEVVAVNTTLQRMETVRQRRKAVG